MGAYASHSMHVGVQDNLWESVLSFNHGVPRDGTQDSKHLYPLIHPAALCCGLFWVLPWEILSISYSWEEWQLTGKRHKGPSWGDGSRYWERHSKHTQPTLTLNMPLGWACGLEVESGWPSERQPWALSQPYQNKQTKYLQSCTFLYLVFVLFWSQGLL